MLVFPVRLLATAVATLRATCGWLSLSVRFIFIGRIQSDSVGFTRIDSDLLATAVTLLRAGFLCCHLRGRPPGLRGGKWVRLAKIAQATLARVHGGKAMARNGRTVKDARAG